MINWRNARVSVKYYFRKSTKSLKNSIMDQTGRDQESYENHASIFWTWLHWTPWLLVWHYKPIYNFFVVLDMYILRLWRADFSLNGVVGKMLIDFMWGHMHSLDYCEINCVGKTMQHKRLSNCHSFLKIYKYIICFNKNHEVN